MSVVLGIARKSGEYEGQRYDNYIFHCAYPAESKESVGQITEAVKVKRSKIIDGECFGEKVTDDDVFGLLGRDITFGYDKYQHVNFIRFLDGKDGE